MLLTLYHQNIVPCHYYDDISKEARLFFEYIPGTIDLRYFVDNISISSKIFNNQALVQKQKKRQLTEQQAYQMSFSEYMQQTLVEAMRFDIEASTYHVALTI